MILVLHWALLSYVRYIFSRVFRTRRLIHWISIFTARKRSLGLGNIFTSVCQEFCSQGGGYLGKYPPPGPGTPPPPDQVPPWDQVHPSRTRYTPGARYPPWTRYAPPGAVFAGRYGQQAGGMHPTGMHSCWSVFLGRSKTIYEGEPGM